MRMWHLELHRCFHSLVAVAFVCCMSLVGEGGIVVSSCKHCRLVTQCTGAGHHLFAVPVGIPVSNKTQSERAGCGSMVEKQVKESFAEIEVGWQSHVWECKRV